MQICVTRPQCVKMKLLFTASFDQLVQTSAGTAANLTFLRDFPQSLLAHLNSN